MPSRAERYVRLYCDDTPIWLALGFTGQTIVMHLLRVLDTEGAVWLGQVAPWELAVGMFGAPEDIARAGMARALDLGVIEHRQSYLVLPRFRDAQKAAASEALRKRESRRRHRDLALRVTSQVTGLAAEDVTVRDMSHFVTPTNGYHAIVAENEGLSQNVTPSVRPDVRTSARTSGPKTTGVTLQHEPPYEDDPSQVKLPPAGPWIQLLKLWERVSNRGLPIGDSHSHRARLEGLWVACHARDPQDPLGVFRRAAEAYCEAQRKRSRTPLLQWFAPDFERYANTTTSNGKRTSPEIEALAKAKALHAQAVSAGDSTAEAELRAEIRAIGKRMVPHV